MLSIRCGADIGSLVLYGEFALCVGELFLVIGVRLFIDVPSTGNYYYVFLFSWVFIVPPPGELRGNSF